MVEFGSKVFWSLLWRDPLSEGHKEEFVATVDVSVGFRFSFHFFFQEIIVIKKCDCFAYHLRCSVGHGKELHLTKTMGVSSFFRL